MRFPTFKNELECLQSGYTYVAGCDEVGVAPLAGPVVAAACILDHNSIGRYRSKNKWYHRVRDSKTTNEEEREVLLKEILEHTVAYGIGEVWQEEIDVLNIHHASRKAMRLATENLLSKVSTPDAKVILFIDGRFKIPEIEVEQKVVVKGDSVILSISAASIIAKVHRDNIMKKLHQEFPQYGFLANKGYPTLAHRKALKEYGITRVHRKSFVK